MTSRALINPLPKKSGVSLRATIQNPRPRKYASEADRQKAFRDRQAVIQVRVKPETVETFDRIATTLGYSRQEVVYALLMSGLNNNRNWQQTGIPAFRLPRYEENPIMRKATPAQLAARERFAEMARSGAFKRKKNPMVISKQADESLSRQGSRGYVRKLLDRYSDEGHVVSVKKTRSGSIGIAFDGGRMLTVANARKKLEDYFGITDTMKRRSNPIKQFIVFTETKPGTWKQVKVTENLAIAKELADNNATSGYASVVEDSSGAIVYTPKLKNNPAEAKERKPRVVLITNPKQRMLNISWLTAGGQREIMKVPIDFVFTHYVGNVAERFFARTENGQLIVSEYSTGGKIGQVPFTMRSDALNDRAAAKRYVGEMLSRIGAERFKAAVKKFEPIN